MTSSLKKMGIRLTVAIVAVSAVSLLAAGSASAGVGIKCPAPFTVQHNDRIGKLKLPAGKYVIKVKRMQCSDASNYFRDFLKRPSGNLPDGWTLNVNKQKFRNKKRNIAFTVRKSSDGGGGGGGGGQSGRCPGTFRVKNNDRIGKLKLPAGRYRISVKEMSCQRASDLFAEFLDRPDGNLPNGWRLNVKRQKFANPKREISFRVKQVS